MTVVHDATEAGEAFLATLGPELENIDRALDQRRDRVSGTLRLTTIAPSISRGGQADAAAFVAAQPGAMVEVLSDYLYRDIVADRFDAESRSARNSNGTTRPSAK